MTCYLELFSSYYLVYFRIGFLCMRNLFCWFHCFDAFYDSLMGTKELDFGSTDKPKFTLLLRWPSIFRYLKLGIFTWGTWNFYWVATSFLKILLSQNFGPFTQGCCTKCFLSSNNIFKINTCFPNFCPKFRCKWQF